MQIPESTFPRSNPASSASLALEALNPNLTDTLFTQYEHLLVDLCARWLDSSTGSLKKIAAFGRIVPFAPHLAEHAETLLSKPSTQGFLDAVSASINNAEAVPERELRELLLGIFRLLSFDNANFTKYVRPSTLEILFSHMSRTVRYLAVRTFCLYLHAADAAMEEMLKRFTGDDVIHGEWEGKIIDYRLLSLWEEKRYEDLSIWRGRQQPENALPTLSTDIPRDYLCPLTLNVHGVLLPRLGGPPPTDTLSNLVPTSTTAQNLKNIALGLLSPNPLLLTGLAGCGKTLLIRHLAWQLNKIHSMLTLHLNEQSDAKLLIGMYTTGAKPGTFSWRPGVLTTAVREGRWIFIEDLDRAPNEVISTLLPLIERGELLIPSRGETIRAARGFKIIATIRTTLNTRDEETAVRLNMIGSRFWRSIHIKMPSQDEFQEVITIRYPNLQGHVYSIIRVYARLQAIYRGRGFASDNGTSLRALTPRDLLKWCDRTSTLLTSSTSFSTSQLDDIFLEALDCFAGSLQSETARQRVMACVAEELHIDPQRRDHFLSKRVVEYEIPGKSLRTTTFRIGRATLPRHRPPGGNRSAPSRPFSINDYTLRLLEKIAVAVDHKEPLLLVGETGTGKTTCIQYLAEQIGRKLVTFNLSQQSESGDLLGGYKPVNIRSLMIPMKDEFDELFGSTFSRKKNHRFIEILGKRVAKGEWKRVCTLWREALRMVEATYAPLKSRASSEDPEGGHPKKKRKVDSLPANFPKARWDKFATDLNDIEAQLSSGSEAFAFSFLEGNIVKAVRNGEWVLLDEINLASSDTLEALADLLGGGPDGTPSILLTETGSVERVAAHPDFRVFAAMNPATDVGKKDLPPGIRSRFTELYVESPDSDPKSLRSIVEKYLGGDSNDSHVTKLALDVTSLYLEIQRLAKINMLVDGADQKAHFSLRTLTRTLSYAREMAPLCSLRRALYEGFHMGFLTFLSRASEDLVAPLIKQHLFNKQSNMKAELGKPLRRPEDSRSYVSEGHYWLRKGQHQTEDQPHYIITPFIQRNLNNLIRAASTRRYPVLIQGPTSSGKTSMIEYLAKRSGNKFVRINNHEHTDLQEYLGTYVSGLDGKLQFQEGILVRALREGHWIVLDELNLAPTDVLEALNRLLDDNRELLIPETQEVVRPHEDFMLFATQNPAGLYGGRKVLSRAFRNRFLELHFDDIPVEELTEILHKRTSIPESWCKRIVKVYEELSALRQENRLFEQKSFATLRDLFRWALRKAETVNDLAVNGYMLLAERVRKMEERHAVKKIIETVMSKGGPRVSIDEHLLYNEDSSSEIKLYQSKFDNTENVVWTGAMRRLFVLVAHAIRNNEPVLLVGETGCGKTTVCQMLADAFEKQLHIVNAHQNTETGDLIGAQRPIRNRAAIEDHLRHQLIHVLKPLQTRPNMTESDLDALLATYDGLDEETRSTIPVEHRDSIRLNRTRVAALFEWADGSLVHAMKAGQFFLLDEISLAEDSVLERLNSVLEPQRTLLLAEKGPSGSLVVGSEGFQFLATMNPGGDYGKRELSPALRNRFTEIWVPALSNTEDILQIVKAKLKPTTIQYAGPIVSFSQWFNDKYNTSANSSISIRDILAWVAFINNSKVLDPIFGIVHGAAMVFIDTLGANPAALLAISSDSVDEERKQCLHRLNKLLSTNTIPLYFESIDVNVSETLLSLGPFSVSRVELTPREPNFSFEAPTTRSNAMRVVRALQLLKPILLEGNPGVGKTTLVTAIAKAVGKPLARLNLSEQTDLMDLFGSDVPVEGGQPGTFAWRDAPFLKAMKRGEWVLLDEMNLASQSVLEGLNAVLDHRGEVYISELDQTFRKHPDFRVFAAQNPHHQGGGRKGLPASFVNRFTVVYADVFRPDDLTIICKQIFPQINTTEVNRLIAFVAELDNHVVRDRSFGVQGGPWEFNLRDTLRWLQLLTASQGLLPAGSARDFLDTIFTQRFRSEADRNRVLELFAKTYESGLDRRTYYHNLSLGSIQVGLGLLERSRDLAFSNNTPFLRNSQLCSIESLMICIQQNWPVILVGPPGSGKSNLINQMAAITGANLVTFSMNSDIDAMDLVGGYEQIDPARQIHQFFTKLNHFVRVRIIENPTSDLLPYYLKVVEIINRPASTIDSEIYSIVEKISQQESASESKQLFAEMARLSGTPHTIDGARFQWVDGLLVRALEQGEWLVLDNANLCNSSVLDRLNSLLEPNGYLSINEHSTADGEAKIIRPHPNFRIFMTMDPRHGELSRAMRNRAVEICLLFDATSPSERQYSSLPTYLLQSALYGFRRFKHLAEKDRDPSIDYIDVWYDHLSIQDSNMIESFQSEISNGLISNGEVQSVTQHGLGHNATPNDAPLASRTVSISNGVSRDNQGDLLSMLQHRLGCLLQFQTTWVPKVSDFYARLERSVGVKTGFSESQSYHPMNNDIIVCCNVSNMNAAAWITTVYEIMLDLIDMKQALDSIKIQKLERRVEKNKIPGFLAAVWRATALWTEEVWQTGLVDTHATGPLELLRALFWAFLQLAGSAGFDRAMFQTYLKIVQETASSLPSASKPTSALSDTLSQELATFSSSTQLTTGISMERIWRCFKPRTPGSAKELEGLLNLESLADRFDNSLWQSRESIAEICKIRQALSNALGVLTIENPNAHELIDSLESGVRGLEQRISLGDPQATPYFEDEFEGICQFIDVQSRCDNSDPQAGIAMLRAKSSLLAKRPTKSSMSRHSAVAAKTFFHLFNYLGLEKASGKAVALGKTFHTSMLQKMNDVDSVTLQQMESFELELKSIGHHLAIETPCFTATQPLALQDHLRKLLDELLGAHQEYLSATRDIIFNLTIPSTDYFHIIAQRFLQPCLQYLNTDLAPCTDTQAASTAWVNFALAGLSLYVPNQPFDPALRPTIERRFFHEKKRSLISKANALQQYEREFTGQEHNQRIHRINQQLQNMGSEPSVPAVARPTVSELEALQGEFSNLLHVLEPLFNSTRNIQEVAQDQTFLQNISHIIKRLSQGYRYYDDITGPAVGFLTCLNIGLVLDTQGNIEEDRSSNYVSYISQHTPFFGLSASYPDLSRCLITDIEHALAERKHRVDLRWHALQSFSVISAMNKGRHSPYEDQELIHNIFSSFYSNWKDKLRADQEKEAANSSLYTYRGSREEESEAEDNELALFPDYETDTKSESYIQSSSSQELVVRLSDLHQEILLGGKPAKEGIKRLLDWSARQLGAIPEDETHYASVIGLDTSLPAIFVSIRDKIEFLLPAGTRCNRNFYFDANISEARRFIKLTYKIQHRYRQIQQVWPEHATLGDVLSTCNEALAFRHVEPVAKFLTKAEKLHGFIHEWERVASREFKTSDLYEELTKLLVSWRQLELTTWARLFDIEMEKCARDAKSWWFIAYENIIAAPESLEPSENSLMLHAKELLRTLESFFSVTTLGQFEQRLRLLQQFREHISLRVRHVPALKRIQTALENFIAYFSRFEKPVQEALSKGRQALEKEVSNVIRLASWKDTNIEALKQSAKTSHRKLSKLVRKFRALLNQPVAGIVRQGFTEEQITLATKTASMPAKADANVSALSVCEMSIPGWTSRPSRFRNLTATTSIMQSKTRIDSESFQSSDYIESFVVDLESSMTQLQKATPSSLTEENKETVKHLKSRKRKLFADTLKEIRQMGFKSNLGGDVLESQDSLSTVLARLPTLPVLFEDAGRGSELYLHRMLSVMAQVREISKEHSGDLTAAEVTRSIGYLESILHSTIRQRGTLAKAMESLETLEKPLLQTAALWEPAKYRAIRTSAEQRDGSERLHSNLSWLSEIVKVAAEIVHAQSQLGELDFSVVSDGLVEWSNTLGGLYGHAQALPNLPQNIWTNSHVEIDRMIREKLLLIETDITKWIVEFPNVECTLKQVLPWIRNGQPAPAAKAEGHPAVSITDLSHKVFEALDLILGSIQDVEKALTDLPKSTEDTAWLVKEEQSLSATMNAFHVPRIAAAFWTIADSMQFLDDTTHENSGIQTIAAMFASLNPIVEQYRLSFKELLDRLSVFHSSACKLGYRLAKSFVLTGTQGFCTPSEKSDEKGGQSEKLEAGTGLGEGEGAEDISKDIQDDEDLTELAQQPDEKGDKEDIEDEKDAVDMDGEEMEGEMADAADEGDDEESGSQKDGDDDIDSEAGDVNDLGPSTVDEKMWDDGGEEAEKDREGDEGKGTSNKDEQVAAQEKEGKPEEGKEDSDDEMEMETGADESEKVGGEDREKMDPHTKDGETLELPDELNMDDTKSNAGSDDSTMGDVEEEPLDEDMDTEQGATELDAAPEAAESPGSTTGHVEDEEDQSIDEEGEQTDADDSVVPLPDQQRLDDDPRPSEDQEDAANSAEAGVGTDAQENIQHDQETSASAANQDEGAKGESSKKDEQSTAEEGKFGQTSKPDAGGRDEDSQEMPEAQPFKKIGDALERWYNQQRQIKDATKKDDKQVQQIEKEVNMADADFEHLPDEETQADTQALGAASEEQAKALDESMALPTNEEEERIPALPEDKDEGQVVDNNEDVDMEDVELTPHDKRQIEGNGMPKAFVGEQKPSFPPDEEMQDAEEPSDDHSDTASVYEVENQLSLTHLDTTDILPSPETARALWLHHESTTHSLAQTLTEHLRLILAPTLATKLRGDFRTGKRLNLKRIIPYIASGYKRDKIWLRRSQPSKRAYQIMIALDDSRSMAESGAASLALKTLTLITRSLAMLEVGEVAVVGFGDEVKVAHEFDKPFTSEAGVDVFSQFGFQQQRTDVKKLVEKSLGLFQNARMSGVGRMEELWQLQLIISDGICDNHGDILRLVRRAQEQRIMVVFIVVDATASQAQEQAGADTIERPKAQDGRDKQSILDLQSVDITAEGKVVRWRYMDRFPFRWYLVVRDVVELPGVLATALRQWFAEVVDAAG
ncbi:midasin [Glonium stellatum]|uniref:Midasin n=1 Tax=Glonium stellatum TaxID=574774 RepID=A0A8E2JYK4_9PEZI|nr:midasin [Glonium stellatum]